MYVRHWEGSQLFVIIVDVNTRRTKEGSDVSKNSSWNDCSAMRRLSILIFCVKFPCVKPPIGSHFDECILTTLYV